MAIVRRISIKGGFVDEDNTSLPYCGPLFCVKHQLTNAQHNFACYWFKGNIFTDCIWK